MVRAITQAYEELVLETSTDGGTTWATICGLIDVEITRSANVDTAEVPDCDDESLPLAIEKQVRSIEVTASGTGVWAQQSHGELVNWFYSSSPRDVRLGNLNAIAGDTEYETGVALLTTLTNTRTKGQKVSASIEIQFDGTPTRTAKA